ncbi:DUF3772 domain-containing protein [Sulfitobacter sp.]|uniref:DUF3772 domain-containing protein n=1 Tax=Sulfitobacter sp. TaxID=1903071 RepID=UPI003299164C
MTAIIKRLAAIASLLLLCTTFAFAQENSAIDMAAWGKLAESAEAAVDDADTSDEVLERLRDEIVSYRSQFSQASGANASRIASLRDQIAQLEPTTSTDGETAVEPADITASRKDLEAQLGVLTAPVQVAETGFTRANGLVEEIDRILRTRQTQALFEVVESPINPVHWPVAISSIKTAFSELWNHLDPAGAKERRAALLRNLPLIVFATIAGLILIARGRLWSNIIVSGLRKIGTRGLNVWRFIVSLLRIAFPLLGLYLLAYAAQATGYLGARGDDLVALIPYLGGVMLGFRWVADQVFAREDDEALITLPAKDRREARFYVSMVTLMIVCNTLLMRVLKLSGGDTVSTTVASFPLTVLIAIGVFCIGLVLRRYNPEPEDNDDEMTRASTMGRLVRSLGTLAVIVAVLAPLLQATGYYNAATYILRPTVLTLAILGLVLALQRFGADVYGAITGQGKQAREALFPIFLGLFLLLLALPVLALAWGARVADLTEIWTGFRRGFEIGNSRISPTDFLAFALIFTVGYFATRLAQGALKSNVLPKTRIDKGGQNAIVSGVGYVGIFLAALAAITGAGIDLSSLAIVAGALSVGIGFGLQNIVSNFVSGIILLIERPISEGDWIEVTGGQMGYVRDISVRSTRIETFDRTDVIVPNADLVSGTVINYTRGNTLGRVIIPVGVAYGTDTRKVEKILLEIANAQPMALAIPEVQVLFLSFGASSLDFEIRIFLRDISWINSVKNDVNHEIARRFAEEGIEIPFPQQDVWLRNPEVLQPPVPAARPAAEEGAEAAPASKGSVPQPDPTDGDPDGDGDQ